MGISTSRLTEERVSRYLTKAALARKAGVDIKTIIRAEEGLPLNDVTERRIADALEMEADELFPPEPVEASA
jgi:transcriptional regulator with XRE-family HTH domain